MQKIMLNTKNQTNGRGDKMLDINKMYMLLAPTAPTGASTHQENDFAKLLEPMLRKAFFGAYKEVPEQFSNIFNIKTSSKAKETDYGVGAFRQWTKFGASQTTVADGTAMPSVAYQKIHPGLERVYVHEEFASGFMVERKFLKDEQYSILEKLPKDLARAGRVKVETDASSLFNDALLVAPTKTIYDGKALFAHDHPLIETVAKTGDNLIDGTLDKTTLKNAILLGRKQLNEAGDLAVMNFDTIVVPPELEMLAYNLLNSTQDTGTNYNDLNTLKGRLKIKVWDYLTGTNSCFLMDSNAHEANFFWRERPQFFKETDFDSLVQKYIGYMRYSFGVSDWRGLIAIKPNA